MTNSGLKRSILILSIAAVAALLNTAIADNATPEGRLDVDGTADGISLTKGAVEPDGWVIGATWLKDKNDQYLVGQFPSFPEWRKAGYTFTPSKDGKVNLYFRGCFAQASQPWTLIDDIEIDGQPIENGSFEGGDNGWHLDSAGKDTATIVDGGHSGAKALKVTHDCKAIRPIDVKANRAVKVTYWHKAARLTVSTTQASGPAEPISLDLNAPWHDVSSSSGRIKGQLPSGWSDDSGWAQAWASYRKDSFQGTDFLHVSVEKIVLRDGGGDRQQLGFDTLIGNPDPRKVYRLTFKARSLTGAAPSFILRMRSSPWTYFWTRQEALSTEWKTCDYKIQINLGDKQPGPMGLWIACDGAGQYDIAELSLVQLSPAALLTSLQGSFNNREPENLMRDSVFPLGLQSGWSLWRSVSDDTVHIASTQEPGEALPFLHIDGADVRLWGEPFQAYEPDCGHIVKLKVRGSGRWSFEVKAFGKRLGLTACDLKAAWQEVEVAYKPTLLENMQQLFIGGSGVLEMAGSVAGREFRARATQAGARPEVALALPPSDASAVRIQFADEPAALDFGAVAAPTGATVRVLVSDVRGASWPLVPIALRGGTWERGRLALNPGRLGSFRVEAWIEKDGTIVSPVNEIVVHRLHRPRGWGRDMPDSPFGVHCQEVTRQIALAKAAGINWVRLHDAGLDLVGWAFLEPEKGQWRFRDAEIMRYRQGNLELFAELGTAPGWASHLSTATNKGSNVYFQKYFQPLNNTNYANYVTTLATHYKGIIRAWDVWNEPWIKNWWAVDVDPKTGAVTSEHPGDDYVRLMAAAYRAVKAVDSHMAVAGFNSTDILQIGQPWTASVLAAGGLNACDIIDYHAYTKEPLGFPGDSVANGFQVTMQPIVDQCGVLPKDVWMTEGSPVPYLIHNGLMKHTTLGATPDDNILIADRLCKYLASLLSCGVKKVFLYSMACQTGEFASSPADWRILTTDDGQLHPSGAAFSQFAWLIEGLAFNRSVSLGDGACAYLFSDGKRTVAAISGRPDCGRIPLPKLPPGVEAFDLFGNPIIGALSYEGRMFFLQAEMTPQVLVDTLAPPKSRP